MVRTAPGLAGPMPALRAKLAAIDKSVAISRVVAMKEVVDTVVWQ